MKNKIISIMILLTAISLSFTSFADTPSSWSEESIQELRETGLFDLTRFENYQENMTRGEFIYWAVTLYEILQNEEIHIDPNISFTDTNDIYALKAASVGITSGVDENRFAPNQLLDRQTMVTFFIKIMNLGNMDLLDASSDKFDDDKNIANWAKSFVYVSRANNIVSGVGDNKFDAKGLASSEVCMILTKKVLFEAEGKAYVTSDSTNIVSIIKSQEASTQLDKEYDTSDDLSYILNTSKPTTIQVPLEEGDSIEAVGVYLNDILIPTIVDVNKSVLTISSTKKEEFAYDTEYTLKVFTMNKKRYQFDMKTAEYIVFDFDKVDDYNKNYSVHVFKIPANPEKGFNYPYYIGVSENTRSRYSNGTISKVDIIADSTNTGASDSSFKFFDSETAIDVCTGAPPFIAYVSDSIFVMPVFPRPSQDWNMYTHSLDRDTLMANAEDIERIGMGDFRRLDLQFKSILEDSKFQIESNGFKTNGKPMLIGFSASSDFANRYSLMHPETIKAVAIGHGTTMPMTEYKGITLNYPMGIADLEKLTGITFNEKAYKALPQLWFRGSEDQNDGTYFYDGWDTMGEDYRKAFGLEIRERKTNQEEILKNLGYSNFEFFLEEGVGHGYYEDSTNKIIDFYQRVK